MNQGREQAEFRKNFSTIDNIFALNQIIEKTIEYNMKIKLTLRKLLTVLTMNIFGEHCRSRV